MKWLSLFLAALTIAAGAETAWQAALPGWRYEFPRDHAAHPNFKTEWWYVTGHLSDERGRRFGFQVTFFRQGLRPPGANAGETSRFLVNDLKFAHFALTDLAARKFHFQQKVSRGAFQEAGFGNEGKLAWIDDWSLELLGGDSFALRAVGEGVALDLRLASTKPWVIHGENGVSQKAEGEGHASHYYSATRLSAKGSLKAGEQSALVSGEAWLDREWATNQLTPVQAGWNWFSLQLSDGTELMLYQMRNRDGSVDPNSTGTFVAQDGAAQHLRRDEYELVPESFWTSPATGARYPISWRLGIPRLGLQLRIFTPLSSQELVLKPVAYWEGLIDTEGTRNGTSVQGQGYMELTGYAGPLGELSGGQ